MGFGGARGFGGFLDDVEAVFGAGSDVYEACNRANSSHSSADIEACARATGRTIGEIANAIESGMAIDWSSLPSIVGGFTYDDEPGSTDTPVPSVGWAIDPAVWDRYRTLGIYKDVPDMVSPLISPDAIPAAFRPARESESGGVLENISTPALVVGGAGLAAVVYYLFLR